jgi:hypothetical protein
MKKSRHWDFVAHEPGTEIGSAQDGALFANYIDVFCNCHHYTEPPILMYGTDVALPAGWAATEAMERRIRNSLVGSTIC